MLTFLNCLKKQLEPKSVELYGQLVQWKYVLLAAMNKYLDFHGSLLFCFFADLMLQCCYCPLLVVKIAQQSVERRPSETSELLEHSISGVWSTLLLMQQS